MPRIVTMFLSETPLHKMLTFMSEVSNHKETHRHHRTHRDLRSKAQSVYLLAWVVFWCDFGLEHSTSTIPI